MSEPKFLVTRFTQGSAGKFLSTLLQTSGAVDHWDNSIQQAKETGNTSELTLRYINDKFMKDHSVYLAHEPMVPYNTNLYSTSFDRGQNVSLSEYLANAESVNDTRLLKAAILPGRLINIIFHKSTVPLFCKGAKVVTVTVTTEYEKNWLYKTCWSKHFYEDGDYIYYIPHDPVRCSPSSRETVMKFNNQYKFYKSDKELLFNKYVINNHTNKLYMTPTHFREIDSKLELDNQFISLSEILSFELLITRLRSIFDYFSLGSVDVALIKEMHSIWLSRQLTC